MDKSSPATCLLFSYVVKGVPSSIWLRKYQERDEEDHQSIKESEIFVSSEYFTSFFYDFFFN